MLNKYALRHPATLNAICRATREAHKHSMNNAPTGGRAFAFNAKGQVFVSVFVFSPTNVAYYDRNGNDVTAAVKSALAFNMARTAAQYARQLLQDCKRLTGSRRVFAAALAAQQTATARELLTSA